MRLNVLLNFIGSLGVPLEFFFPFWFGERENALKLMSEDLFFYLIKIRKYDILIPFIDLAKSAIKEKVVRVIFATFRVRNRQFET